MDYREDWQNYFCRVNGIRSSVFVDLGYMAISPISFAPMLSWLWIKFRNPRSDGLSSDAEFDALVSYEDELTSLISETEGIYYVGRITGAGRREFYFYSVESLDLSKELEPVLAAHPEYKFQFDSKSDHAWSQYHDLLYPGPRGLEQIQARAESKNDRAAEH